MKSKWKAKIGWLMSVTAIIALMAAPAWATSNRFLPGDGYAAQLYEIEKEADQSVYYQGSLDIVYAEVAEFPDGVEPWKTRCIMKVESGVFHFDNHDYSIRVMLYDYTGKTVITLAVLDVPGSCWGQGVKLDANTNTIWFSYTNGSDRWYSFSWDDTLAAYKHPVDLSINVPIVIDYAGDHYEMKCNWEMEVSTDPDLLEGTTGQGGQLFFAGLNSSDWEDPHSVWVRNGDEWQKVIEVGGSSCGFAFDNMGNLWHGAYHYYITQPNYVYMWTAAQIDYAVRHEEVLDTTIGSYTTRVNLPMVEDSQGTEHRAGANDLECDPNGNVYVSVNGGFDSAGDTDCGYVLKIENDGTGIPEWPGEDDYSIVGLGSLAAGVNNWDWLKALAYDGESFLEDDGILSGALTYTNPEHVGLTGILGLTANRLYLDHDYYAQSPGIDTVSAITRAADSDEINEAPTPDGVPDAVDNAYLTFTADECQIDWDQDMYGNICDCDLDNNRVVDGADTYILRLAWGSSDPNADFDSNDVVDGSDISIFRGRWDQWVPFF